MVRRVLDDAGRADLVAPAQLLVSEVVTNALMHSGTPIDVSMAASADGVLVEVGDGSVHIPRPRRYAATASTGRGLALLEQTADSWGVVPGVRGKTVWFQLSSPEGHNGEPDAGGHVERPDATVHTLPASPDRVTVQLCNVPLLLHAAWQQHAEAVLREYLLASLDVASETDPLEVHAACTDALALLAESIPRPAMPVEPEQLLSSAVGPHLHVDRVRMAVPNASVEHFALLSRTLDQARLMGEADRLLVPPVQPEMRLLRHWICGEVVRQTRREAPIPWPPPEMFAPPPQRDIAWDFSAIDGAAEAVVAADDTDIIVAASEKALAMLGYERDDLVGRRLVAIIPERFRQAHLAGFSMYLLTGRGPLLGNPVQVPARHRDGSEVLVELTIEAHRVAPGRSLFVATMEVAGSPA
jgi:PAS domain S-box-containing protein